MIAPTCPLLACNFAASAPFPTICPQDDPHFDMIRRTPATNPPRDFIQIICRETDHSICMTSVYGPGFVSVADIVENLHTFMRSPAAGEYALLGTAGFLARVEAIRDAELRHSEFAFGVRKVDVLDGLSEFGGLAWMRRPDGSEEFSLVLKPTPQLADSAYPVDYIFRYFDL
jgi:hypothetical protein